VVHATVLFSFWQSCTCKRDYPLHSVLVACEYGTNCIIECICIWLIFPHCMAVADSWVAVSPCWLLAVWSEILEKSISLWILSFGINVNYPRSRVDCWLCDRRSWSDSGPRVGVHANRTTSRSWQRVLWLISYKTWRTDPAIGYNCCIGVLWADLWWNTYVGAWCHNWFGSVCWIMQIVWTARLWSCLPVTNTSLEESVKRTYKCYNKNICFSVDGEKNVLWTVQHMLSFREGIQ